VKEYVFIIHTSDAAATKGFQDALSFLSLAIPLAGEFPLAGGLNYPTNDPC